MANHKQTAGQPSASQPNGGPHAGGRLVDHISLGVLAELLPRDLIEEVLAATDRRERRVRRLPAHVVVRFCLAMCLFAEDDYDEVLRKLAGGLLAMGAWDDGWQVPTTSAVTQARKRLGVEPLRALFEQVAVPVATPGTKGAWLWGRRLVAIDGFRVDVPDTAENVDRFGRAGSGPKSSAFPQAQVVGLAECGARVLVGAVLGGCRDGEQTLAAELVDAVEPDMLVLADRNFYSWELWHAYRATGADLLWRVKRDLTLPVLEALADGSFRSALINPQVTGKRRQRLLARLRAGEPVEVTQAVAVRVVEYEVTDRAGRGTGELITLVTSLLDPGEATAVELAACYAQRWEVELLIGQVTTTQRGPGRVLRSRSPDLVEQELWALLLAHYGIGALLCRAADEAGVDPDRLSFLRALRIVRRQVADQAAVSP
jgi:hypothetical protein